MIELIFIFIFGAVVGSFLNVCIVRMPHEQSIVFPGSHCPSCKKPIVWSDNIPLISYILLRGQCRNCKAKFSIRYFFVELLTAITFVLFYIYYGPQLILIPYLFMVSCFIVAIFVDFAHRIIPDEIAIGGMFAGIAFSALIPRLHQITLDQAQLGGFISGIIVLLSLGLTFIYPFFCKDLMEGQEQSDDKNIKILVSLSLLMIAAINFFFHSIPSALTHHALSLSAALSGYIIGGGMIYIMGMFGDIVFKKESMGGGDVKLLAMIGAFLGWEATLLTFFIAPVFGAIFGIIEKIRTKDSAIAYGPFLIAGALITLFFKDWIISFLFPQIGM